jgi:multidrug transporter EmrE-like cation transporter
MSLARSLEGYAYLLGCILFTIYGLVVMKWQIGLVGELPTPIARKILFLLAMFLKPWVLTVLAAGFLASLCWMATLTRLPLSAAYPCMSLAFVGVVVLSAVFFGEPLSVAKWAGMVLLMAGIGLLNWK